MIALAIAESAAQGTDLYLQVRFFDKSLWPGSGDQFLFADYLAGALDERGQDVESATNARTGVAPSIRSRCAA
jgi:hypothetical protein